MNEPELEQQRWAEAERTRIASTLGDKPEVTYALPTSKYKKIQKEINAK